MSMFRLGTTSYILPDDILPNVRYLADRVQDVELVLFEVEDGLSNLPSEDVIGELSSLTEDRDLTFTVHLPLDLALGGEGEPLHRSLQKAQAVIERTRKLDPWAYVLHVDGEGIENYETWVRQATASLNKAALWAGSGRKLAVENLEGYPLDYLDPVLEAVPASRCIDVGHLWVDGHDPLPYLRQHLGRTRVIHLHGIGSRDHQSLDHMDRNEVERVVRCLRSEGYEGVLTLEVFGQEDFASSMQVIEEVQSAWQAN